MILLTFAHRAEARAFLTFFSHHKADSNWGDLYISKADNLAVVITGEGYFEASISLGRALGKIPLVSHIINMGVAGALSSGLEQGDILIAKHVYRGESASNKSMSFKSAALQTFIPKEIPTVSIVTATERVLDKKQKTYYGHFGDLVDRELWGLALTASKYKIPISSIKIVSDSLEESDFCELVKEKADKFSNDLLQFFIEHIKKHEIKTSKHLTHLETYLFNFPSLFFTKAQKNLLKKFSSKVKLSPTLEQDIENIIEENTHLRPKDLTKIILDKIEKSFSPTLSKIKNEGKNLIVSKSTKNISFKIDSICEYSHVDFAGKISSEKDRLEVIAQIEKLPLDTWHRTIEGEREV